MKSFRESFLVRKENFDLKDYDPAYTANYPSKKSTAKDSTEELKELRSLQDKLFASKTYSLLIILQAMDCAGKDGLIRHICSGVSGQGAKVHSFSKPERSDYNHNYLRRFSKALPAKGLIGIFNRSYYEHTLVCRVHPELILEERIPGIDRISKVDAEFWAKRFEQIRDFEKTLLDSGTIILKFFLNLSKEKQKERLLQRIDKPEKQWKFSYQDIEEREHWNDYQEAYEEMLINTSREEAPWYVIPADHKWFTRVAVTNIINETLKDIDLRYPRLAPKQKLKLEEARNELTRQ